MEDERQLAHFCHEGRRAELYAVRGAHPGEDPVEDSHRREQRRHEAPDLGENDDARDLPEERGLAAVVRTPAVVRTVGARCLTLLALGSVALLITDGFWSLLGCQH